MLVGFAPAIAIVVAAALGVAATAYLWMVRLRQAETAAGIDALAGMRWREFSRLLVEALQTRGFAAESVEQALERGPQAEVRLMRDGRVWLLACKQAGARAHLGAPAVRELAEAVRFNGAAGGILATPAHIGTDAHKAADSVELLDGEALWALVGPMLPASLHADLTSHARRRSMRETVIAWVGAVVLGALAGIVPALLQSPPEAPTSAPTAAAPVAAKTAPRLPESPAMSERAPDDPNREQFERSEVIHAVSALPWVERALWSTGSTLFIQQREDVEQTHVEEVCSVLRRYDSLRASRLQLQPPADSQRTVRFLQCSAY